MYDQLKQRWVYFATRNIIPHPEHLWECIETLYTEEGRYYHNLEHIEDCLNKLDHWPTPPPHRDTVELAIWFHDIIYDTRRADNEESSAALATHYLRGHPMEVHTCALILATRHKITAGMEDEEVMCDIDLSILGAQPKKYQAYATNIRKEYAWVDEGEYCEARAQVLTRFLNKRKLFQTPYAIGRWENQARKNIELERESLLAKLD